jgi:hypothetical protein
MSEPVEVLSEMPGTVVTPMGGLRRAGRLAMRPRTTLVTLIGGLDLDLTRADVPPAGSTIAKVSLIGGAKIVVGPDVRVDVGGFSLIGGRDVERVRDVPAAAPVVRIRAWSLIGGIRVRVSG